LDNNVEFIPVTSLRIIDTNDGCCHSERASLTFVKLPRHWALQKAYNVQNDTFTLQRVLLGTKLQRGKLHLHVAQNYRTFGMFCARNSKTVLRKEDLITSTISAHDKKQINYICTRANELALRVLPTEQIKGIREAHKLIKWKTMGNNSSHSNFNLWAAAASSCNYVSASHVDDDFFTLP
jgi:hypothetical protein